jgi:hypothetical protein
MLTKRRGFGQESRSAHPDTPFSQVQANQIRRKRPKCLFQVVGGTGIEPVAPTV